MERMLCWNSEFGVCHRAAAAAEKGVAVPSGGVDGMVIIG